MGHTSTNVLVHVLFATKNREKVLTAAIRNRLHAYIAQVINDEGRTAHCVTPSFGWQQGYSAFSVSYSQYRTVYDYIEGQEAHHRERSFEDELLSLLKRHEMEYDERYLWS